MALQKITYENKTALLAQPSVANTNKISDTDMNEIKTVVNAICDTTDNNTTNINDINTKITNLENKTTIKAIIDVVYPVGSIYISKDSTNPGTLWPGTTWEREAEGRCIIGIGTGYSTVGATGGSSTVTLDTTQIPSHSHTGPSHYHTTPNHSHTWSGTTSWGGGHTHSVLGYPLTGGGSYRLTGGVSGAANGVDGTTGNNILLGAAAYSGDHNHTISGTTSSGNGGNTGSAGTGNTGATGGNGSHNNMQPYIVMYIWRRIA
mgnify:CR=1 FL=1|jgi:microcystin-dependent protein